MAKPSQLGAVVHTPTSIMKGNTADVVPAHSGPIHRAMLTGSVNPLPQHKQAGRNMISERSVASAVVNCTMNRSRTI